MKINGIEIKPGMVIKTRYNENWVVFPTKRGLAVVNYHSKQWGNFNSFIKFFKNDIETIYDLSDGSLLTSGIKLW